MCVIFKDRRWVVHKPFVCMVKFKLFAHLPVDHLANPVVSRLVLLLCQFTAFAYYYYYYFTSCEFFTSTLTDDLLLERKQFFHQVSRTLLSIPADLNNVVVLVSIRPAIFNFSYPLSNSLRSVQAC